MDEEALNPKKGESLFVFFSRLFKSHGIRPILVGGFALAANKLQRMTYDVDFIMTSADLAKIENAFIRAGYSVFNRQPAFVQLKSNSPGRRDVDLLIADPGTMAGLFSEGKQVSIAGEIFTVPSPLHLIAMKLHAIVQNPNRELKDWPDIIELMALNGINPQSLEVSSLFKKQGAEFLYEKTVRAVRSRNEKKS